MDYVLYVDEAGCTGELPAANSKIQPIFCIVGLIVPQEHLSEITNEFLHLKRQFNPKHAASLSHDLAILLYEIKGSDLRSDARNTSRNKRRRVFGLIDQTLDILERYNCKLLSRGYIKAIGEHFDGNAVYTYSVQSLFQGFQKFLSESDANGLVVADSRRKSQNNQVSYSVFTKKFKRSGDEYPNVMEMPVFGHSENHVGLQITDWIASTLMFPILSDVYCKGHVRSVHVNPRHELIKDRYVARLKDLQYRYREGGSYKGGITIVDSLLCSRSSAHIFRDSAS